MKTFSTKAALAGVAAAIVVSSTLMPAGAGPNPRIQPPQSRPYGKSYAEWSAGFWQWFFSMPVTANPLFGTADLSAGQSGKVWYLGGIFGGAGNTAVRSGTVPAGTALFFPIVNGWGDNSGCADSFCPPTSFTVDELRGLVGGFVVNASDLSCTIDGVPVRGLEDAAHSPYRAMSPVFSYTVPADPANPLNWLFLVSGCYGDPPTSAGCYAAGGTVAGAVADGVYLMLTPLPTGNHTIHFSASLYGRPFLDVTYNLTVNGPAAVAQE